MDQASSVYSTRVSNSAAVNIDHTPNQVLLQRNDHLPRLDTISLIAIDMGVRLGVAISLT